MPTVTVQELLTLREWMLSFVKLHQRSSSVWLILPMRLDIRWLYRGFDTFSGVGNALASMGLGQWTRLCGTI